MSRQLLQRVIDEGRSGFRIKSMLSPTTELDEHWAISKELKTDIERYLSRARKRKMKYNRPVRTEKGQNKLDLIYDYIVDCIKEDGFPPTVREIRFDCEISSTSVVSYYLDKLEEEGLIKRKPFLARGITVT